jgi:hypothetical protein
MADTTMEILKCVLSLNRPIASKKQYGADDQLKIKLILMILRAEFVSGKQPASLVSSETKGALFKKTEGYYVRKFNGSYFYFLQHLAV